MPGHGSRRRDFVSSFPSGSISSSLAPSFVEAVAGQQSSTPDPKQIALAEELLVRLEKDGVAVRLNLLGQPGEQPDYVVAAWVLPYVYALRGDRDWRRTPQLTGSRQVSPLAIQAYKRLEAGRRDGRRAHAVPGPRSLRIRGAARHHRAVAAASHHSCDFGSRAGGAVAAASPALPEGHRRRRFDLAGHGDLGAGFHLSAGGDRRHAWKRWRSSCRR